MAKGLVFISLTVLFLGFMMYQPLPPKMKDPWKFRAFSLMMDGISSACYVMQKVFGKPVVETYQQITDMVPLMGEYSGLEVQELHLDGIPVRMYTPKDVSGLEAPAIVYLHGGGWVMSNLNFYDPSLAQLALDTKMVVIAVRYRTAPQHPFPIPFDDCVKAVVYVLRSGREKLGVDVNRVALFGDSAGGNLVAAVSLRLAQEDPAAMPKVKLQVMFNPVLQALSFNIKSWEENGNWYLSKKSMIFFWAAYLGLEMNPKTFDLMAKDAHVSSSIKRSIYGTYIKKVQSKVNDNYDVDLASKLDHLVVEPFVAPLMADDLSKVPPAYVIASEMDILRDEAVLYAERLKKAGVTTDLWLVEGRPHVASFYIEDVFTNVAKYIKKRL